MVIIKRPPDDGNKIVVYVVNKGYIEMVISPKIENTLNSLDSTDVHDITVRIVYWWTVNNILLVRFHKFDLIISATTHNIDIRWIVFVVGMNVDVFTKVLNNYINSRKTFLVSIEMVNSKTSILIIESSNIYHF